MVDIPYLEVIHTHRYDEICKRIISQRIVIAKILKSVLLECRSFSLHAIMNMISSQIYIGSISVQEPSQESAYVKSENTESLSIKEGNIYYDTRFTIRYLRNYRWQTILLNIEVQNNAYPGYPLIKRAIYYASRMISEQKQAPFQGFHYEKIKKSYPYGYVHIRQRRKPIISKDIIFGNKEIKRI